MRGREAAALEMVFDALSNQTHAPVLLAVDSAQALYRPTKYLSSDETPYLLDSTALSLPRLLLDYASGRKSFQRGAVLFASSYNNAYQSRSVDIVIDGRQPGPFEQRSTLYEGLLKQNMKPLNVDAKMDLQDAAGLAELLKNSKRMRTGQSSFDLTCKHSILKTCSQPSAIKLFFKSMLRPTVKLRIS